MEGLFNAKTRNLNLAGFSFVGFDKPRFLHGLSVPATFGHRPVFQVFP